MDFKTHLETAWRLTIRFIAPLILMTLAMSVVGILTLGILAPVTLAGYMHSLLLMLRDGREPKIGDIFSQMGLFLPLLGFGILVFLATLIGFMLLVLPGVLVVLAVCFSCLYMLPLMTDAGMGLFEAVRESYRMSVSGQISDQVVVVVVFVGLLIVGSSVFVGALFTQPLATVFLLSVYEEKRTLKG